MIAIPFLVLCAPAVDLRAAAVLAGAWTLTTLLAMYGSFGFAIAQAPGVAPALAPGATALTRLAMSPHAV